MYRDCGAKLRLCISGIPSAEITGHARSKGSFCVLIMQPWRIYTRNYRAYTSYEMFRPPLIFAFAEHKYRLRMRFSTCAEWNHISYCKLINLLSARVGPRLKKKKRGKDYAATTNQFHPPVSILHSQLPVRVNATDAAAAAAAASALARIRVHCGSLRRANFASPARQAYFAYWREERPFDVVTTKPPGLHPDSLSRQPWRWREKRRSGCVRFALNGILQAQSRILQAVGCLTCQVNHRQPLEPSSSPSHSDHPFLRAISIRLHRFSHTSSISACRNFYRARSNKGYYAVVDKWSFLEAQSSNVGPC